MKSKIFFTALIFTLFTGISSHAQHANSAEILKKIYRLNSTSRILYFAAHPDDENTRLIAYLNKGKNIQTAYFSLTRGDGGQNLIGDEKGALLGIIRTQELLAARSIDGGTQYFSRAVDFGYSKSPEETFKHWDKDSLLADAVRVIREFQPDIIITRFPPDSRAGHGHHTVSAMIAELAYDAAADPNQFPESAKLYGTWQVQKLYWNESSWWNRDIAKHADEYVTVNIGTYDPYYGESYSEIASRSRSQHQSQGFGMSLQRGDRTEYLKLVKGDSTASDALTARSTSLEDLENGKKAYGIWKKMIKDYRVGSPVMSIDYLVDMYWEMDSWPDSFTKRQKMMEIKTLIADCSGLYMDFRSDQSSITQDDSIKATAYVMTQSNFPFLLEKIRINGSTIEVNKNLNNNYIEKEYQTVNGYPLTNPYWLDQPEKNDFFTVEDRSMISRPENGPLLMAYFDFHTPQGTITYERPLMYQWTDRVTGEERKRTSSVPHLSVQFTEKSALLSSGPIHLKVTAHQAADQVYAQLYWEGEHPGESEVLTIPDFANGQTKTISFNIDSLPGLSTTVYARAWTEEQKFTKEFIEIKYSHIPVQTIQVPAKMTVVGAPIKVSRNNFAYLMGSGDEVPAAMKELGCTVKVLDPKTMSLESLKGYDGIIVGIRAFNTLDEMSSIAPMLQQYVENGGFVMVQYNTNRGLKSSDIGPHPIKLSRERVTEEDSDVEILAPQHEIFQSPNAITKADFDNWVQERGLYFAGEWDENYTPLLRWNDTGANPSDGSTLACQYGKGHYVFTGISFFRQLPAGVPGAYKLFANLISYGKNQ